MDAGDCGWCDRSRYLMPVAVVPFVLPSGVTGALSSRGEDRRRGEDPAMVGVWWKAAEVSGGAHTQICDGVGGAADVCHCRTLKMLPPPNANNQPNRWLTCPAFLYMVMDDGQGSVLVHSDLCNVVV